MGVRFQRYTGEAQGTVDGNADHPKISIRFERRTFEEINARAKQFKTSFAEAARLVIDYGLDKLRQEDEEEERNGKRSDSSNG